MEEEEDPSYGAIKIEGAQQQHKQPVQGARVFYLGEEILKEFHAKLNPPSNPPSFPVLRNRDPQHTTLSNVKSRHQQQQQLEDDLDDDQDIPFNVSDSDSAVEEVKRRSRPGGKKKSQRVVVAAAVAPNNNNNNQHPASFSTGKKTTPPILPPPIRINHAQPQQEIPMALPPTQSFHRGVQDRMQIDGEDEEEEDEEGEDEEEEEEEEEEDAKEIGASKQVEIRRGAGGPRMDPSNDPDAIKPARIAVPHVLGAKTMNAEMLRALADLHGDHVWQKRVTDGDALFQQDLVEHGRSVMHNGMEFRSPTGFDILQIFLNKLPKNNVPMDALQAELTYLHLVPTCDPEFNAKYLYVPLKDDPLKPCISGDKCIAMQFWGFNLVTFESPLQAANRLKYNTETPQGLCLVCDREFAGKMQAYAMVNDQPPPKNYVYQTHRNPTNKIGKYKLRDCLMIGAGILYPILDNKKHKYRVMKKNGRTYLQEEYELCTQEDIDTQNF
jgi:hypothetical protein